MTKFSLKTLFSCKDFLGIINHSTGSLTSEKMSVLFHKVQHANILSNILSPLTMVYLFFKLVLWDAHYLPLLSYKSHFRFCYL